MKPGSAQWEELTEVWKSICARGTRSWFVRTRPTGVSDHTSTLWGVGSRYPTDGRSVPATYERPRKSVLLSSDVHCSNISSILSFVRRFIQHFIYWRVIYKVALDAGDELSESLHKRTWLPQTLKLCYVTRCMCLFLLTRCRAHTDTPNWPHYSQLRLIYWAYMVHKFGAKLLRLCWIIELVKNVLDLGRHRRYIVLWN